MTPNVIHAATNNAERQAQVLGDGPRIAPMAPGTAGEGAHALMAQVHTALGMGDMADFTEDDVAQMYRFLGVMFHHPSLMQRQLEVGLELLGHGLLPPIERELAILRTGWLARAPYEWSEHVLIARGLGLTTEDVERVIAGSDAPGWTPHQRALLCAVEQLHDDCMIADATWAVLAQSWNAAQLIELPVLVGQYRLTAGLQNSLRLPLNEYSRGLEER